MDIKVPKYCENGLKFIWEDGFQIKCSVDEEKNVCIEANPAGLISLARHLLMLAQNEVPENEHFHLDEYNSLESGSAELVIVKKNV